MKKVQQKDYTYEGCGFPVVIDEVIVLKKPYADIPLLDHEKLLREVLLQLAQSPQRLTGNQVQYIRKSWELPLARFGALFDVAHSAVMKWERSGDGATSMNWTTEKDLRLRILQNLGCDASAILHLYKSLLEKLPEGEHGAAIYLSGAAVRPDYDWQSEEKQRCDTQYSTVEAGHVGAWNNNAPTWARKGRELDSIVSNAA